MIDRNKQVATALLIVLAFGIGIFLIRWRFSPTEDPPTRAVVERKALPPAGNAIDVGPSPMPSPSEESYSQVVSGDRYFAPAEESAGTASDEPLTEEECQAFVQHVETLEFRANPSAASASKDPKAIAAKSSMCKKGQLSPKFARCAMTKNSTKDFLSCGGKEIETAMKKAKAVLKEFEKPGE